MPYNKTGIASGKDEISYGESRVFKTGLTITDYESGGVPFVPQDAAGVARVDNVVVDVADGTVGYHAHFDYENNAIVLTDLADGTEVADTTTVNLPVRVRVEGTG